MFRSSTLRASQQASNNLRNLLPRATRRTQTTTANTPNANANSSTIRAPAPGSGPLMSRSAHRALPPLNPPNRWLRTAPLFLGLMAISTWAIFNYQKSSSSVVSSTLYALRTNGAARELLGEEIYFAQKIPWIRGSIDQVHGKVDIGFWVKGTRGSGWMKYVSLRKGGRNGKFETIEWSLEKEDGEKISLMAVPGATAPVMQNDIASMTGAVA